MGGAAKYASREVNGTDVIPLWDHAVTLLGDHAVIVYPQVNSSSFCV